LKEKEKGWLSVVVASLCVEEKKRSVKKDKEKEKEERE